MRTNYHHKTWRAILLATALLAAPAAFASSIQFNFDSGGTPAATAVFVDDGPNQVQLTITALTANPINSLFFNFNPLLDAHNLIFTETDSVGGVLGGVSCANDSYKVGGGSGKFDINLKFGTSPSFVLGDSVTFSISGIAGLSVDDFLFQETPAAGTSPNYAAGSLQELDNIVVVPGTPNEQSVPDVASTCGLLVLGLLAIGFLPRYLRTAQRA
jgi:hypothetical protein